ncbi:unnamed protein product, partial [Clonostachys chloroleuca]
MGREKRNMQSAASSGPKERHRRTQRSQWDPKAPMPQGFVAKPTVPKTKSKHHSYFELVENEDKKKKLEFQVTTKTTPPPGFEFVPSGNPELTTACKELSREKDAMIFIVSARHHIRETIVEEARSGLTHIPTQPVSDPDGKPMPLPDSQDEYTAQANASILDFFPRIPNTDRQTILVQSFNLSSKKQHPKPVGLCTDIPLSRRVQLAVLAHIRHTHTRYDELLKETSWLNARKVVEGLCLDILVKWRGDEETGRDQLDEILREVVVISDSEDEDGDDDQTEESSAEEITMTGAGKTLDLAGTVPLQTVIKTLPQSRHRRNGSSVSVRPGAEPGGVVKSRTTGRKEQRGFKRYRAWEEAIQRNREGDAPPPHEFEKPTIERRTPYSGVQRDKKDKRNLLGSLGTVPHPNGFVPKHHRRSGSGSVLDMPPRPRSASLALSPRERRSTPVARELPPSTTVSRIESPLGPRLQDMLVRSIEPASPEVMQPSFVRALPPRVQHSPSRTSLKQRPVRVSSPWESSPRAAAVYTERGVQGERQPIDPLPRRHLGYGEPTRDFHSPQPNDFVRIGPRPPTYPDEASIYGARTSAAIPTRTIFVDAGKPGSHHQPIIMEDRGGFYERVPLNPQPYRPAPVNGEIWPSHPIQAQGREASAHRIIPQENDPRSMRDNRRIRDAEATPVTGLRTLAPEHYSRLVPVDYNEQQWSHNRNLYDTAPRSPAQNYQRRMEPETGAQRAGEGVAQPPYHYTQYGPWALPKVLKEMTTLLPNLISNIDITVV